MYGERSKEETSPTKLLAYAFPDMGFSVAWEALAAFSQIQLFYKHFCRFALEPMVVAFLIYCCGFMYGLSDS